MTWLALAVLRPPAIAQSPPEAKPFEKTRSVSYGVEIGFGSGHADRGFIISDRPVIQPVVWVSASVAEFSVWGNVPLAATTDSARPQILELELTRAHQWKHLSIAPAIRTFFYDDPLGRYHTSSMEGWLYLSYDVGPFSLFTNHSVDVLTYRGAYFGEAGVESAWRASPRVELGASFGAGWASSAFNDAWVGIRKSALNRIGGEAWLTAYVTPHCYLGPLFKFNSIVDHGVRAELARPTYVLVGFTTGVEF